MHKRIALLPFLALLLLSSYAAAQAQVLAKPKPRIVKYIDDAAMVSLPGNVNPLTAKASESRSADPGTPMQQMVLHLQADSTQEAQLEQLIAGQHDPHSPYYHKYLNPDQFGAQFGVAQQDIAKVTDWLESHGFKVDSVPAGKREIVFSGTAEQVSSAFKTEIRQYTVNGAVHYANAANPQIPDALAGTVSGIVKLHDFRSRAHTIKGHQVSKSGSPSTLFTQGSAHALTPSDYSVIYDINALYSNNINGSGESIAILARSDISLNDVQNFRSTFGLVANNPQFIVTNSDPGVLDGDTDETTLDTEWSGAVAPNATVKVIISASTNSEDGIDLSAMYAVNNNVAPIVSLSYGQCEAYMGSAENAFYNSLWKQAAAQGQTVLVSAGDSGAAGCNGGGDTSGIGPAVNALCTSPYSTCVGGTEFVDQNDPGQYWLTSNNSVYGSAISYIPEAIWNESALDGGSGLWSGGGGVSIVYPKPAWQTGPGVPNDGQRDVPDISMAAASHDGYFVAIFGGYYTFGGTSCAAPSLAGIMALVDQKTGSPQGLINPIIYPLSANQASGGPAVFHDITSGNNSVPAVAGFSAGPAFDLASGVGTVDANMLVNNWTATAAGSGGFTLSASASTLTVVEGSSAQVTITSAAASAFKSAVTMAVSGAPTGITATFATSSIASPGSGSDVLKIAAGTSAKAGSYTLLITGMGGGQTESITLPITVPAPSFALAASVNSTSIVQGSTGKISVTAAPSNGFASSLALTVSGLPSGVTAAFSPTSLSAGAGTSSLTFTVAKTAATGSHTLTITATGGGLTRTASVSLAVAVPPSCTLAATPSSATFIAGLGTSVQVNCGSPVGAFSGPLAVTITGAPAGMAAAVPGNFLTPGSASTLALSSSSAVVAGKYTLALAASGSGFNGSLSFPVTVNPAPTFALSATPASVSTMPGTATKTTVSVAPQNGFNSAVALSAASLPTGVTAAFSATTLSGGNGSSTLTFFAASNTKVGSYSIPVTAAGGAITKTMNLALVVNPPPSCTLAANPSSITLTEGKTATATLSCGSVQGTFTSTLAVAVSELPTGVTGTAPATFAAGSSATLSLAAASTATPGSYSVSVHVSSGTFSQTLSIPVSIPAPTFTLASNTAKVSALRGATAQLTLITTPSNGFSSSVALSVFGLPTGVTPSFSGPAMGGSSAESGVLILAVGSSVQAGSYPMIISATGGGVTKTTSATLTVLLPPVCTLNATPGTVNLVAGQTASAQLTCAVTQGTFSGPLALSVSGAPAGVKIQLAAATMGAGSSTTLSFSSTLAATTAGSYSVSLSASTAGYAQTISIPLKITMPSTFNLTVPATSLTVKTGSTGQISASTAHMGAFNSAVSFSTSSLPAGVTAAFSPASIPAPGNGTVGVTFNVSSSAKTGTYSVILTATGGGVTQTSPLSLTIAANPNFTFTTNVSTLTIAQGSSASLITSNGNYTGGFNGQITVTISGLGTGMTWNVTGANSANGLVNVTYSLSASSATPLGVHPITITATGNSGTIVHQAVVQVTVTAPAAAVKP